MAGKPAKNSKAKLKLTEAECLRCRRASVTALSQRRCRSATVVKAAARCLSKPVWTESHGKLESDLDKIGSLRKHVAFDLGALLPREHPSAEAATEHRKRVLTNSHHRHLKKRQTNDLASPVAALGPQVGYARMCCRWF